MPLPLTAADLVYGLAGVAAPSLSPDGGRIAFVHSIVSKETHEAASRVMVLDANGGEPIAFTSGPADALPRWSPDGRFIAFLRKDGKKLDQVWVIPSDGGEGRRVTDRALGVVDYAWSPDSARLVVSADVPDPEDDPAARVDGLPMSRTVKRIRYRYDSVGWRGEMYRHLFVVSIESGEERQLTDGAADDLAPAWSPDGTRIAFVSGRRADHDTRWRAEAYVVPAEGGAPECWSGDLMSVSGLGWSPDSTRLCAVVTDLDGGYVGAQSYQGIVALLGPDSGPVFLTGDGAAPASLAPPLFRSITLSWRADDRVRFLATHRGRAGLYEVPARGGATACVAPAEGTLTDLTVDATGTVAGAAISTPYSPSGIAVWTGEAGPWRVVTDYNREFLDERPPASMTKFALERAGMQIESRVMLPPDFDPALKYPMVLDIHGGPNGAFLDTFMPDHHMLATHGYVVLAVNPRGSSTYGVGFMTAVFGDWGGEDYLDIMQAVDEMASRPYIDAGRMGVHGYSYGGFMTTWAIGHTNRFKAAVAGAPVTDLSSFYGTSDIGVSFGERQIGGRRADALERYLAHSPITHAASVETPVLLIHGETDVRVPVEQSEQYHVALKRLGKPVEFVRFPNFSHLSKRSGHPVLRQEYGDRMLAWFDRYLKG